MIPTARDILTRPTQSAPRRALLPGEHILINNSSKLACFSLREWHRDAGPTAAVERAHSYRARSGSKGTCIGVIHPLHRARSASKGIVPATPPLFQRLGKLGLQSSQHFIHMTANLDLAEDRL